MLDEKPGLGPEQRYSIQVNKPCKGHDVVVGTYGQNLLVSFLGSGEWIDDKKEKQKGPVDMKCAARGRKFSNTVFKVACDLKPCDCAGRCPKNCQHGWHVRATKDSDPVERVVVYVKKGSGIVPEITVEKC